MSADRSAEASRAQSVAIAITGASGAIYATRTVAALLERGVHVELIVSDYGRRLLRDELGDGAAVERFVPYLTETYGDVVKNGSVTLHSNRDLGATLASGGALPAWLSFNAATRIFSGTPGITDVGVVSIKVMASDTAGMSVSDTFDLTVSAENSIPRLVKALSDRGVTEDKV